MSFFDLMVESAGKAALPRRSRGRIQKSGRYPTPIVIDRGKRVDGDGRIRRPKTVRSRRTRKRVAAWKEKYGVLT